MNRNRILNTWKATAVAAIVCLLPSTASAQDDIRAIGAAVDTIVRLYTQDYITAPLIQRVFDHNHRSAPLGTRIAKAFYNYNEAEDNRYNTAETHKYRYFHKNDTVRAMHYIRAALRTDSTYAPAYVLAADMFDYDGNPELAMDWLEMGMKANPRDSSLYIAEAMILARTDIELATKKLEQLRQIDPNLPVDMYIARIYEKIDITGVKYRYQVADYYGKMSIKDMPQSDVETMVLAYYQSGRGEMCNTKAKEGLRYFPKSLALNRYYLRTLEDAKECEKVDSAFEALKASEAPQNYTGEIVEVWDYLFYAKCLTNNKNYDRAMDIYETVLAKDNLADDARNSATIYIHQLVRAKVADFFKSKEYQKGIDVYADFVAKRKAEGSYINDIAYHFGRYYLLWSQELEGAEKEAVLMKADEVYKEAMSLFKEDDDYYSYQRWAIRTMLDPNNDEWLAYPFAIETINVLKSKGSLDESKTKRLVTMYNYLMGYEYFQNKDKKAALAYADLILDLDPFHQNALKFQEILSRK